MQHYLNLTKPGKFNWQKYFLLLIENPIPAEDNNTASSHNSSAQKPRTTSHYNLNTIYKAIDMSA